MKITCNDITKQYKEPEAGDSIDTGINSFERQNMFGAKDYCSKQGWPTLDTVVIHVPLVTDIDTEKEFLESLIHKEVTIQYCIVAATNETPEVIPTSVTGIVTETKFTNTQKGTGVREGNMDLTVVGVATLVET